MPNPIRFALVLHNHQPIGNFEHVFEQAYQESYLPFLDVFERYDSLKITLAHQRLADGVDRRPSSGVRRPARQAGRPGPDRDHRRPVLRADPGDAPFARPRRTDPQLHQLAREPPGGRGPRHVDARTRLGAVLHPRPGRSGHRIHRAGRFPFQECRPGRVAIGRPFPHRGRRPRDVDLPGQRAAPLPDPLRVARANDRVPRPDRRASIPIRSSCLATTARNSARGPARTSTSTTTAGSRGSSTPWWPTRTGSTRRRWPRRSTTSRRSARSICPTAATAK